MKRFTIFILVFLAYPVSYGQVKVNPNGKFFNYNGTKIYYEDSGTGEPLLLLHKFFGTADNWKPYAKDYSKQFRTIAVDMIGHGRSDIYNKEDLDFNDEEYAKIILALLDSLKLDKVNAIGASGGGTTLHYLNLMQPERFKSIITIGGHIYFSTECREIIARSGIERFMNAAKSHGPEKQEYLAKAFWEYRNVNENNPSFTSDKLNTFKANWLVVLGDDDPFVPLQLGIEMHEGIPNSWLWIVPHGGHTPHLNEDFQTEFKRVSLEFLTGKWNKND
ncbi:alpha/beta hydrolase [Hyunsoonleella flava]|uniref:Alpha/beta hydrolase n=1 Tax=Hyunsoonleella flava TaxID=2527939 RepID=A0A4V2JA02_9FLAO|nr:alpha/beta hydrolase [Hyunsoonleella flava]TBN02753.1 alpha/beta hydrolase [Hyunsoonleella flava]